MAHTPAVAIIFEDKQNFAVPALISFSSDGRWWKKAVNKQNKANAAGSKWWIVGNFRLRLRTQNYIFVDLY